MSTKAMGKKTPLLFVMIALVCACDPVDDSNESTGKIRIFKKDGSLAWSRENLPRWKVLTFDEKNENFGASYQTPTLNVQAGKWGSKPYPYWDLLLTKFSPESNSQTIANSKFGIIDNQSSLKGIEKGFNTIEDISLQDSSVLSYGSFTPASHNFNYSSSRATGLRVYDRGSCSSFNSWSKIYNRLATSFAEDLACNAECGGEPNFWGGYNPLEPNDFLDYVERKHFGFFPIFRRKNTDMGYAESSDGFGLFGLIKIGLFIPDRFAAFYGSYQFSAKNGNISISLMDNPPAAASGVYSSWRVRASEDDTKDKFVVAVTDTIPNGIAEAINSTDCKADSSGCRKIHLPNLSFNKSKCSDIGSSDFPCLIPRNLCGIDGVAGCAKDVSDTLTTLGNVLVKDKDYLSFAAGVNESDFSCESELIDPEGSEKSNFCVYKIPFGGVNVYPDGFEILFQEPQIPKQRGVIDAFATIEAAKNDKDFHEWESGDQKGPKPTPSAKVIPYCQGRFSITGQPVKFDFFEAPSVKIDVDICDAKCD